MSWYLLCDIRLTLTAYQKWNNPVFKKAELKIPSLMLPTGDNQPRSFAQKADRMFNGIQSEEIIENIEKAQLERLQVIAQVDKKFIACRLVSRSSEKDLLVMVDQHAADERVRLERFLAELYKGDEPDDEVKDAAAETEANGECIVDTIILDPPCRTTMQASEVQAALRHKHRYTRWGILFTCPEMSTSSEDILVKPDATVRVEVSCLPRLIADRCVVDPGVVRDVIRQHLYWLEEGLGSSGLGAKCPRGILDILNSKACRQVSPSAWAYAYAAGTAQC